MGHKAIRASLCAAALIGAVSAAPAQAELFGGACPSDQILARFVEFGKTGKMPPDLGQWLGTPEAQAVAQWKPFDNVDFVGICWVSAWLVHTEDGVVLIDTLYGPYTKPLIAKIEASGVDLADIRYVLMTHGHFDHVGGAMALKEVLPNAQFVMTQDGWDEALTSAAQSQGGRREWNMIAQDVTVVDGDEITLGGNTFRVYETPGHTWGTASYTYDVSAGDDTYRAITIGGLGLNAIEGPSQVGAYIASVDRVRELVEGAEENVQVHLTTHGFSNNLEENRAKLAAQAEGEVNVFVDPQGLLSQVATLRAGAVERLEIENSK